MTIEDLLNRIEVLEAKVKKLEAFTYNRALCVDGVITVYGDDETPEHGKELVYANQ